MTQAWAVADKVSKKFFATQALDSVTLHFHAGRVHALAGENGAGKSTLMKLFGGVHLPDEGEIRLGGKAVSLFSPHEAIHSGVVVIPQEMRVVPAQTVAENVMLGDLPTTRFFGILPALDRKKMRIRTAELLDQFGVRIDPDRRLEELGFAERQIVMIARALNHSAKFLIMDEPTAALETREIENLFAVIQHLKAMDVAIAFISHYLEEIAVIADTCSILRDGRVIPHSAGDGLPHRDEIVRLMTGRDVEEFHAAGSRSPGAALMNVDPPTTKSRQAVGEIAVHEREILGLAGLLGGGMTEFLRSVYGAGSVPRTVRLKNFSIVIETPSQAIGHGIGLVPRERAQGLIMGMTVRENIILPNLTRFTGWRGLDKRAIDKFVANIVAALDIRPRDPDRQVRDLSGGNQQKVIFARWLAGHIDLLLLDEPTHGVDIGAKSHIHRLMDQFAEEGRGIVFASSEMAEIMAVSDTVLAMRSGEFVARISRDGDFNERALRTALLS